MLIAPHQSALRLRRHKAETQKDRFLNDLSICQHHCSDPCKHRIPPDILLSWQRSRSYSLTQPFPTLPDANAQHEWTISPLRIAAEPELAYFEQLTHQSNIALAIADAHGKLLWTQMSASMEKLTKNMNFTVGTYWAEHTTGTNALAVALTTQRPCTVFSAEHYLPECHEIVCYAAPIIHPLSQQIVGVVDMVMEWQQHTPLAQTAVAHMARNIAYRLPHYLPKAELEIHALGAAWVLHQGQRVQLSLRQLEILCILALHPAGLSLESLHQALCGNESTHPRTIKTIMTQLRHLLHGCIGSHPYRLLAPVWADFIELSSILRQRKMVEALKLYHGEFLPSSIAPALETWRHHLEADMENLLYDCQEAQILLENTDNLLCTPMVRERLLELIT